MAQSGIFDQFNDTMMSPLFLGGAALMTGEGMGGAVQGMQAGNQFAMQRQKQAEQQQRRQAFDQMMQGGQFGGVPPEMMKFAQAAGPDAGIDMLAKAYQTQQGYGQQERMARLQHDLAMKQQANDPLRALQIQALQQKADPSAEFNARRSQAAQLGLQEGTPQFQAFVGTGKFLREDQQPLTATDKKAILEADETVMSTKNAIGSLERALELSGKAYDGATANERAWVTSQFGDEAGMATRELKQTVTEGALQQLKAIFGGMPTEGERKVLLEVQGSAELPQKVRENIYRRAIQLAQNRLKFNEQRANEMRGGTYYKPQGNQPQTQPGANPLKQKYGLE